ncbi:putative signal transducing protein [Paracoccus sulfuroxidans]|uniref:Putative signal transducing protein n=2 Tax=Paracoccus sulfuroxidans TaxID=384678 RepID=A0A562NCS7_9RHOB|nr:putative signal transducing protein [Paracoccus sulfuroxidans]
MQWTVSQPPLNYLPDMKELLRTTDPLLIPRVVDLLASEGIEAFPLDAHMSVLEGSLGILPRRLMVADRDHFMAKAILRDFGLHD